MNPIATAGFELHNPEVVAAGVSGVDLRNHLVMTVAIDICDDKCSHRVLKARAIEIRLQRMACNLGEMCPTLLDWIEFHDPEIIAS